MNIGKLTKVEVRELWSGEASDFTPWLANEENIALLGEAIGIELEVIRQEQRVGAFRADIICKDTLTDKFVLIENQLERTDHIHLGQIMTYAAGQDAVTIVWIAKTFSDEHRAALDWLNRITDESINFFGIEIEAYKIGDSIPAPMFQLVAKPNDWSKSMRSATLNPANLTPTQQLYLEYWSELIVYLEEKGSFINSQKPQPQSWTSYSVGKSDFHITASASATRKFIRVEFYFEGEEAKDRFRTFKMKYEVEATNFFGNNLEWRDNPRKVAIISIKSTANIEDKKEWQEQFEWLKENLEKMDKFFRPRIKTL